MTTLNKVRLNDGAVVLIKRNSTWHMQLHIGTKYYRQTCATTDLETAKAVAYAKYDDLRIHVRDGGSLDKSPPVHKLFERYKKHIDNKYPAKKARQYQGVLDRQFVFYFKQMPLDQITEHTLTDWYNNRQKILTPKGTEPTSSTIHNELVTLKDFFMWCVDENIIRRKDIPDFPKIKVTSQRRPALVNGADKKLLYEANRGIQVATHPTVRSKREDLYTYIVMMLATGTRSGELASIGAKHLEKVKVKQKGRSRDTYSIQILFKTKTISGKKDHKRIAVVMPDATKVIDAHIKKYEKLGIDISEKFWPHHTSFENGFDNLLKRCNMKTDPITGQSFSIYSLRHTYITHRLIAGVTSDIIATQCGTSVDMIEKHYSNVVPMMARNKIVALDEDSVEYKTLDTNFNQLFEEK